MLLWTFIYLYLFELLFSFLWGLHLGEELLHHMVTVFNWLRNCQTVFQMGCTVLCSHQQSWGPSTSTPLPTHHFLFWVQPYLWAKCYLIEVFPKDECFYAFISNAYWPWVHLLWRHIYSNPLPVFNWPILLLSHESSLYTLSTNPLSHLWCANILAHSLGCLFPSWKAQ